MEPLQTGPAFLSLFALTAIVTAGCTGPEIKRDTPQATVATLIKTYEAKKLDLLNELVAPTLMRVQARSIACFDEQSKSLQCTEALIRGVQSRGLARMPEGCPIKVSDCFCGQKGQAAAKNAKPFQLSEDHRGLLALQLSAKSCSILGVDTPEEKEHRADMLPGDPDAYCDDILPTEELALVRFKCGDTRMAMALGRKADLWSIIGIPFETHSILLAAAQNENGAKYRERLNSDLK